MSFFFKQKTAYEIEYGLVGSEMCIRDRSTPAPATDKDQPLKDDIRLLGRLLGDTVREQEGICLLYTSDAADERSSVDLGGRRIIKTNKIRRAQHVLHDQQAR